MIYTKKTYFLHFFLHICDFFCTFAAKLNNTTMSNIFKSFVLLFAFSIAVVDVSAKEKYNPNTPIYYVTKFNPEIADKPVYPASAIILVATSIYDQFCLAYPTNDVRTWIEFDCTPDNSNTANNMHAILELGNNDILQLRFHGIGEVASYGPNFVEGATVPPIVDTVPWWDVVNKIDNVLVEQGVTSLGKYLFADMNVNVLFQFPNTLREIYASVFPQNHIGEVHCSSVNPPTVIEDIIVSTSFYLSVPVGSGSRYTSNSWWGSHMSPTGIDESDEITIIIPTETIYNTKVTLVCEVVPNADKYLVKVWNSNTSTLLYDLVVTWDDINNKWSMQSQTVVTPAGTPRKLPILHRDTVRGTTETMQIDITSLTPSTNYNYSVTAMSGTTVVSEKSGRFSTPNNKPAGLEQTIRTDGQPIDGIRYSILGLPVDESYKGIVVQGNRKYLRR